MKKINVMIVLFLLSFCTFPALAEDNGGIITNGTSTKQEYLKKRFKYFDCGTSDSIIYIDMADVSSVAYDRNVHSAFKYWAGTSYTGITTSTDSFKNRWWVYMKNGSIHHIRDCVAVKDAFVDYINFLINNTEFSTI